MATIRPVVLSGGSGSRLWPLSTPGMPKQFAGLLEDRSLFELTLERVSVWSPPIIVAGAAHDGLVRRGCAAAGVEPELMIFEPQGRNTAPACVAAALHTGSDEILLIVPSDHLISSHEVFRKAVAAAADHAAAGSIVVFGVLPTRAETGYGYIEMGEKIDGGWAVAAFTEKPGEEEARAMMAGGTHLWNSGMFVLTAEILLSETRRHASDLVEGVERSLQPQDDGRVFLTGEFAEVEAISFDHAVMEHTARAVALPLDAGWDDIGSLHALWAAGDKDTWGNVIEGDVVVSDVRDSLIKARSRRVAAAGLSGMAVVETAEGVVVIPLDRAQEVRALAEGDIPE